MPKRASHKVAARQSELSKRKKRGKPNISNVHIPSGEGTSVSGTVVQPTRDMGNEVKSEASTKTATQTTHAQATTKRERGSASALAAYSYVGPEVRNIAIVTGLMLAIIVALAFVLK